MWVLVNGRWHVVTWTDPDYVSFKGEGLHQTRCGLLKIRLSYALIPADAIMCKRCSTLLN